MDDKSIFQLCWDIIFEESIKNGINGINLNSVQCKIQDTNDTNFDILENRLAYTYKFGCFNIRFFEKCFLNFINDYLDFETVFPLKKLKVCSLSNGPGFDIIGLLCALCISNKPLRKYTVFNALNMFHSWLPIYETLINKACDFINQKFPNHIHTKQKDISLIQGDIFSTLSPDVKNYIRSSNVLLMVKVYFSSKTTVNKFADSLRKIFLLTQPGTLIFFIGSENNMNSFARRSFLSNYVETIYGPKLVTLENIEIDEIFSNIIGEKPVHSGHAHFVVWQKRKGSDIEALKKEPNKSKKKCNKEKNIPSNENIVSEMLGETVSANRFNSDSESELSYTSRSISSDVSVDLLKKHSYSSEFASTSHDMKSDISSISSTLSQNDNNHSIKNITSMLDKVDLGFVNCDEHKTDNFHQNSLQVCGDSVSDLTSNTEKEFSTDSLVSDAKSSLHFMKNASPQLLEDNAQESKDNLNLKCVVSTPINTEFSTTVQCMSDRNESMSYCTEKIRENAMQSLNEISNQHVERNSKDDPKVTFRKDASHEQSFNNLVQQENNIVAPEMKNNQKPSENFENIKQPSLYSLIEQCGTLVTSLEKLTISLKDGIENSKNNSHINKHSFSQPCKNHHFCHHCCCCVKVIHTCCCHKMCNN